MACRYNKDSIMLQAQNTSPNPSFNPVLNGRMGELADEIPVGNADNVEQTDGGMARNPPPQLKDNGLVNEIANLSKSNRERREARAPSPVQGAEDTNRVPDIEVNPTIKNKTTYYGDNLKNPFLYSDGSIRQLSVRSRYSN